MSDPKPNEQQFHITFEEIAAMLFVHRFSSLKYTEENIPEMFHKLEAQGLFDFSIDQILTIKLSQKGENLLALIDNYFNE